MAVAEGADHHHHHNEVTCEVSVIICTGVSRKLIATPPPLAQVRSSLLQRLLIALHPLSATRLASQMWLYSTRRGVCQSSSKGPEAKRAQKFMPKEEFFATLRISEMTHTFQLPPGVPRVCAVVCGSALHGCDGAGCHDPDPRNQWCQRCGAQRERSGRCGRQPDQGVLRGQVCVCVCGSLCVWSPTTRARLSSSTPPLLTMPNPKAHGYLVCVASQLQHGTAQQCFVRDSSFLQRGGRGLVLTACQVLDSHTCGLGERILHLLQNTHVDGVVTRVWCVAAMHSDGTRS